MPLQIEISDIWTKYVYYVTHLGMSEDLFWNESSLLVDKMSRAISSFKAWENNPKCY